MQGRNGSVMAIIRQLVSAVIAGILDSLSFHRTLILLVRSPKIRLKLFQCSVLNGVIFLGSIVLFQTVLSPLLGWVLSRFISDLPIASPNGSDIIQVVSGWIEWVYYTVWIVPVYLVSFILNSLWYRDIALESKLVYKDMLASRPRSGQSLHAAVTASPNQSLANQVADIILRCIFNIVYLIFLTCFYQWRLVYCVNMAFLISFNSFEYKLDNLTFHQKVQHMEKHWIYYLFFSLWVSILITQFPSMVENGLLAVVFPFLLMNASTSGPPVAIRIFSPEIKFPIFLKWCFCWLERLPVFFVIQRTTDLLVYLLDWVNSRR